MSPKVRRSPAPVHCDCLRATHSHGTRPMYDVHRCGCDPCLTAKREYVTTQRQGAVRKPKPAPTSPAEDVPVTARGEFVATFPVYGGTSQARAARQAYDQLIALTREQGVAVKGAWQFRLEHTRAGRFLTAWAPAETSRPIADVVAAAELFAYEHERAQPALASWITEHLKEAA